MSTSPCADGKCRRDVTPSLPRRPRRLPRANWHAPPWRRCLQMPSDDRKPKSDGVGYKRPPKHTQFRPGQSGNPKGRPKGTQNLKSDLREELGEIVRVREGDRE